MFRDDSLFVTVGGGEGEGGIRGFWLCRNKIYLISHPCSTLMTSFNSLSLYPPPIPFENHVITSKSSTPYPLR